VKNAIFERFGPQLVAFPENADPPRGRSAACRHAAGETAFGVVTLPDDRGAACDLGAGEIGAADAAPGDDALVGGTGRLAVDPLVEDEGGERVVRRLGRERRAGIVAAAVYLVGVDPGETDAGAAGQSQRVAIMDADDGVADPGRVRLLAAREQQHGGDRNATAEEALAQWARWLVAASAPTTPPLMKGSAASVATVIAVRKMPIEAHSGIYQKNGIASAGAITMWPISSTVT
jgi:hypothetical protein